MNSCRHDAFVATTRICKIVADTLKVPMISNKTDAEMFADDYDIILLKTGVMLFCDFRERMLDMLEKAKKVIVLDNDYAFKIDSRVRKIIAGKTITWNSAESTSPNSLYINWNRVGWLPVKHFKHTHKGLFYYGSCRKDREEDFVKYMGSKKYPVLLSCDKRNMEQYSKIIPAKEVTFFARWSHPKHLTAFDHAMYIEDETSHTLFTSPAQRFYEYVSAGLAVIIDSKCETTFEKAGLPKFKQFMVSNSDEVAEIIKRDDGRKLAKKQMRTWDRDYIADLKYDIKNLWRVTI